jgi:hypothetical protein
MTTLRLLDTAVALAGARDVVDELSRLFDDARTAGQADETLVVAALPEGYEVTLGHAPGQMAATPQAAVELAAALLNQSAVAGCSSFAVHAGVVARGNRTVAFPATSGTGKSTLTAALLASGWSYLSDEALALDDGTTAVRPYPRPLALHSWTLARLGLPPAPAGLQERLVVPVELGASTCREGAPLTDVLLVRRGRRSDMAPAHVSEAAVSLLTHSFNHYLDPPRALRLAGRVAGSVRAWRVTIGDPVETAGLLDDLLR